MKIGILETDHLEPAVRARYGSYADMFKKLFLSVDAQLDFIVYDVLHGELPESPSACDAYIISGSHYAAYDNETWIHALFDFIRQLHAEKHKLIGICFGHQAIAMALGGVVRKNQAGWGVGNISSPVLTALTFTAHHTDTLSMLYSHQDQVMGLPPEAILITATDFCPICSYQIGQHILTFQGHPEFTLEYMRYILEKRRSLLGENHYAKAKESLHKPLDNHLIATYILEFIAQS